MKSFLLRLSMFKKIFPILVVGLWALSGTADDMTVDSGCQKGECPAPCPKPAPAPAPAPAPCPKPACPAPCPKPCPAPCPKPACPAPCPKPACPKPCPKPACPKPCPPKPCPAPCPPKPCCNPPPPCCWNFNPCNPKGCSDMNCGGFYLSADFLYWRSENHGFSYAYQPTDSLNARIGKVVRVQPDWDPGFRVGAGWNTTYDFWDVFLNYTWYRNNAKETRTNLLGFIPLWPVAGDQSGVFGTVSANSRFMLNMGDLEVGRMVYLTKSVALRPHWGVRGGTLHQKFNNTFTEPLVGGFDTDQTFKGRNNYWGVGPRTGVNGEWHLNQGFSILGKLAGALLYGKDKASSLTETLTTGFTEFTVERQYTDDFYQLVPNLQLSLGFQWQTCFWCEKMLFKMSAAWEANYWWDQFNLPYSTSALVAPFPTVGSQPLSMEGLTVNFEWDF